MEVIGYLTVTAVHKERNSKRIGEVIRRNGATFHRYGYLYGKP